MRGAANASGIEQARVREIEAHVVRCAAPAELEGVGAFDEEGPLLIEERLDVGEIHNRRIDLDLTEVGIHGGIESEVRTKTKLEVGAQGRVAPATVVERVSGLSRRSVHLARGVGGDQQSTLWLKPGEPHEGQEARHETAFLLGTESRVSLLVRPRDHPLEVDAPSRLVFLLEAKLRKRDAEFGRPTARILLGAPFPHAIPGVVVPVIVEECAVEERAAGGDAEVEAGALVVVGIEIDGERIGCEFGVSAAEKRLDFSWVRIEKPGPHVNRVVVVQDANLRLLGRLLSLVRIALGERGVGRGGLPRGFIELAVDADAALDAHRLDLRQSFRDRGGVVGLGRTRRQGCRQDQ